ncbi:MAG: type II toxin-antitoxin system RelE/ParE family toxin [Spirochaetales bacterium]|nr:type II toxin-antitoxin system RelE/ParE family toxin [Spirochaetales bacterium]
MGIDISTPVAYHNLEFIETSIFTRQISSLVSDNSYSELQEELIRNPKKGDLIVGGGGIRKIRWGYDNHRGKSSGIRVIYYYKEMTNQFLMLFAYPKNVADDLTDKQVSVLKEIAKGFHDEK